MVRPEKIIEKLVNQRNRIRDDLRNFRDYIRIVEQTVLNEKEHEELEAVRIETELRLEKVSSALNTVGIIREKLDELLVDEAEINEQKEEYDSFETNFFRIIAKAKQIIGKFKRFESKIDNEPSEKNESVSESVNIQLPNIPLPQFNGSYNAWIEFRDKFTSLIHGNPKISKIQKYHYLRQSLSGRASQAIKTIEFGGTYYEAAWSALCNKYNNSEKLVQNHVKSILEYPLIGQACSSNLTDLADELSNNLESLRQLGEPVESWSTLIIYVTSKKLDPPSKGEWIKHKKTLPKPVLTKHFVEFIKGRADLLEDVEGDERDSFRVPVKRENYNYSKEGLQSSNSYSTKGTSQSSDQRKCSYCKKDHFIWFCPEYLSLNVRDRRAKANNLKLCLNCLKFKHDAKECQFGRCLICEERHNTVLHTERISQSALAASNEEVLDVRGNDDPEVSVESEVLESRSSYITTSGVAILSTAEVLIENSLNSVKARALLDCGSQSSFISKKMSEKLKLPKIKTNLAVAGINNSLSYSNYKCEFKIRSIYNNFECKISCFILDKITGCMPEQRINKSGLEIPLHIQLADSNFNEPNEIDLLIGIDIFWSLILPEQINLGKNLPTLQNTRLGWIVAGPLNVSSSDNNLSLCNFNKGSCINDLLYKFWEIEEIHEKKPFSEEERECEAHLKKNLSRDLAGKFIVSLPLKYELSRLGDSKELAKKRFFQLEKRLHLKDNSRFREMYCDFLDEYEKLNHMTLDDDNDSDKSGMIEYYLPHHGVLREDRTTTKLRVVFNASARTTSGYSLNDLQMTGPTIQDDLVNILLRFRMHAIVISSDVKMMYRCVWIDPKQRCLQKIFWRKHPSDPLLSYKLNTVTYGTTAASFLAIRCLHEAANEIEMTNPSVAQVIKNDMYVDDLLSGAGSVSEAVRLCAEISRALKSVGFELRKWSSNDPDVFQSPSCKDILEFYVKDQPSNKTLGLYWSREPDSLNYTVRSTETNKVTKRIMLSRISTIFDPLGLLSPCIIVAKIMLQRLWLEKLGWDDPVPPETGKTWQEFQVNLTVLNNLSINRKVSCTQPISLELHGFSDASERAYGACVYVKSVDVNNKVESHLLIAKSKVAPLQTVTMPRLELMAALLLARLISKAKGALYSAKFDRTVCWTDSTIVLGWLQTPPSLLKSFVDNRVAEIQNLSKTLEWRHVSTHFNPADSISRGVCAKTLGTLKLWWHGPLWLVCDEKEWPRLPIESSNLPDLRKNFLTVKPQDLFPWRLFSNFKKLQRVTAYILRFIFNCKKSNKVKKLDFLSTDELNTSVRLLVKLSQQESFDSELRSLKNKKPINTRSNILNLTPFLDNHGIIRVGGRLSNSPFYSFDKKHPMLLSSKHPLSNLIFKEEHKRLLHAGPRLLLSNTRERFWVPRGLDLAKKIYRQCVKCARFNLNPLQPIMGNLPHTRIEAAPPFSVSGVDYSGPFTLKDRKGRGVKFYKGWLCLFVCFITRAVHLELVSSLSTDAFIDALKRFSSRRGTPSDLYCDNGTNFVGAHNELSEISKFLASQASHLASEASKLMIRFHFIPVNSPNFGGLWEAGVRSVKHHVKRVAGNVSLTYEDFSTLLIQVEAVLNSRPLFPLSSDPNDLSSLTPAHFLIGRTMQVVPEIDLKQVPQNRLSTYQHLQYLRQHFWERWNKEFISELQVRTKWKKTQGSAQVGQLVVVKEDNLPPTKWRLGRILGFKPGQDGIARVAILKTADGTISRAMSRICPLPVNE